MSLLVALTIRKRKAKVNRDVDPSPRRENVTAGGTLRDLCRASIGGKSRRGSLGRRMSVRFAGDAGARTVHFGLRTQCNGLGVGL